MTNVNRRQTGLAVVLGVVWVLLLHAHGHLVRTEWMPCLIWMLPLVLVVWMTRSLWRERSEDRADIVKVIPLVVLLGFLVLHLFSGGTDHGWFYFLNWIPSRSCVCDLNSGVVRLVLFTALLWPLLLFRMLKPRTVLLVVFIFCVATAFYSFISTTGGAALYRDDHPSFMFRLHEFSRTYPQLVNYCPYWNGGEVGYVESVSGTTGLGILLWPLWRFAPVHLVYTPALAFLFIIFVPLMVTGSLRIMGARWSAGLCAGIMALGVSQHFFLWLLNYGTAASCLALCFTVPFYACVFRVVWLGRTEKWLAAALVLSAFFLLQWPPGAIMAAPALISMLVSWRKWTKKKILFLIGCGLAVLVLYSRTILLFLTYAGGHMNEVLETSGEETSLLASIDWGMVSRGWEHLLAHVREGHPLVIFFGLAGVLIAPARSVRKWFVPVLAVLALATGWGREVFPKLQISRMAVPMFFIAIVPAGLLLARVLNSQRRSLAFAQAALLSLLLLGGLNVACSYGNENARTHYVTMTDRMHDVVDWIKQNTPPDGRILIAGWAVHVYGGGHTAYLPCLTGREMMCCDYYAFPPETHEYKMPPRSFQKSAEDIFQYMDIYNVTHVITFHDRWKRKLREHPEYYEELKSFRDMSMFKALREPEIMLKGSGTVEAEFNMLKVRLDPGQDDVVLRYNWIEGLSASDPVDLYPYEVLHGVKLLGIRPHGEQEFRLRFRSWL